MIELGQELQLHHMFAWESQYYGLDETFQDVSEILMRPHDGNIIKLDMHD